MPFLPPNQRRQSTEGKLMIRRDRKLIIFLRDDFARPGAGGVQRARAVCRTKGDYYKRWKRRSICEYKVNDGDRRHNVRSDRPMNGPQYPLGQIQDLCPLSGLFALRKSRSRSSGHLPLVHLTITITLTVSLIGNESVPTQLAQCRFPGLAISNAKI